MATALGVLLAMEPYLGAAVLATWLVVAGVSRYSSLAALLASVLAPGYAWVLSGDRGVVGAVALMAVLLVWRHRANIRRLVAGEEGRIGRAE